MDLMFPFQVPTFQNAFLMASMVAVPCALLSCFLVLKGWALMGDAVSHAVLPGIVLAYVAGVPLLIGAFVAGFGCAVATGYIAENSRVKPDTVMGVVFSGMFGIGLVLFAAVPTSVHLDHILYGNILGVDRGELWTSGGIAAAVSIGIWLTWRDLLLQTFDPAQAQVAGLPVTALHYGLLVALSLTIVATLSAVGLVLAIGLVITPGAVAFLVVRRFGPMLIVSVIVACGSMFAGVYLSIFIGSDPAATVILVLTVVFLLALAQRGIRTRRAQARTSVNPDRP